MVAVSVGAVLIGISALSSIRRDGVASAVGAAIGISLLAVVVRWVWVRFGPGRSPVLDPPRLALMVGLFAVVSSVGGAANESDGAQQLDAFLADAAAECPDPIAMMRQGGVPIVETDSGVDVAASTSYEAALIEHTTFAEVDDSAGPKVVMFVAVGFEERDRVDFLDGVADGVERRGGTVLPLRFGETPGYGYTDDGVDVTATFLSCHAVLIWADSADATEALAGELIEIDNS